MEVVVEVVIVVVVVVEVVVVVVVVLVLRHSVYVRSFIVYFIFRGPPPPWQGPTAPCRRSPGRRARARVPALE